MGYMNCFLIRGYNEQNELIDLEYYRISGTYSCADFHYFLRKRYRVNKITYDGKKNMEEDCFKFSFDFIKSEYKKYSSKKVKPDNSSDNDINDEQLEDVTDSINDKQFEELEIYYEKCLNFETEGYTNIELLYGIGY